MKKINISCNYTNSDIGEKADKRKQDFCKKYDNCLKCPCYVDLAMKSSMEAMTQAEIIRFGHKL